MTTKTTPPQVGQGELFTGDRPIPVVDDNVKRAFGWAVGVHNPILAQETFPDITEADLPIVDTSRIRGALYGRGRFTIGGLAVNELEYTLIPTSARSIDAHVAAKTAKARTLDTNPRRKAEAIDRSVGHTLLAYADRDGLMKWLSEEGDFLTRIRREMDHPGHRRSISEQGWLMATKRIIELSFGNMLHVVGLRKDWDEDMTKKARQAMLFRLARTPQRERVGYWRDLTDTAINYNQRKQKLFTNKLKIAQSLGERSLANGQPAQ